MAPARIQRVGELLAEAEGLLTQEHADHEPGGIVARLLEDALLHVEQARETIGGPQAVVR